MDGLILHQHGISLQIYGMSPRPHLIRKLYITIFCVGIQLLSIDYTLNDCVTQKIQDQCASCLLRLHCNKLLDLVVLQLNTSPSRSGIIFMFCGFYPFQSLVYVDTTNMHKFIQGRQAGLAMASFMAIGGHMYQSYCWWSFFWSCC